MKVRVPKALRSPALEPEAAFNTVFPPLWLPRWLSGKESACQCRRRGPDSRSGTALGEENGNPLQRSCLGNPVDRGAQRATVHGVAKSRTRLSDQITPLSPC